MITKDVLKTIANEMVQRNLPITIHESIYSNLRQNDVTLYTEVIINDVDQFQQWLNNHLAKLGLTNSTATTYFAQYNQVETAVANTGNWIDLSNAGLKSIHKY